MHDAGSVAPLDVQEMFRSCLMAGTLSIAFDDETIGMDPDVPLALPGSAAMIINARGNSCIQRCHQITTRSREYLKHAPQIFEYKCESEIFKFSRFGRFDALNFRDSNMDAHSSRIAWACWRS